MRPWTGGERGAVAATSRRPARLTGGPPEHAVAVGDLQPRSDPNASSCVLGQDRLRDPLMAAPPAAGFFQHRKAMAPGQRVQAPGSGPGRSFTARRIRQYDYVYDERNTAAFLRSLVLPGNQPDHMTFDRREHGRISVRCRDAGGRPAVAFFGGRQPLRDRRPSGRVLAIARVPGSRWERASAGIRPDRPIELSMVLVGIGLALAAVLCLAGSIVGWLTSPSEPGPLRPHMPPPTHQA